MSLPIEAILDSLIQQFSQQQRLVIQAPPGAGKTTRIPLALLERISPKGKIVLIQPRRLAVYSAARQLASNLGEAVGNTVGYRTRYDKQVSKRTQVEVITDGLFVNQIQNDPELNGISVVIFDEFHERSTNMDLGLAFALETQGALRDAHDPLHILVMSATLNGEHLSQWLQAPLLVSDGRSFPVQTYYQPLPKDQYLERFIAALVAPCLQQEPGNILIFLPGMKQIRQLQKQLEQMALGDTVEILPLHASLPAQQQEKAILPCESGRRKVVLATNVAETSITIEDVRVVIDSGLARVSRYDERRGFNQLITEHISKASAEQRSGRAGRTQAGICYRIWGESKQQSLKAYGDPQILTDDLTPIVLQLARWGVTDGTQLMLLDQPAKDMYERAQQFLLELGALQTNFTISELGRTLSSLPLPPRLGALVWRSRGYSHFTDCCFIAAVLSEGDPLSLPGDQFQSDLDLRLGLQRHNDQYGQSHRLKRVNQISKQLRQLVTDSNPKNTATDSHHLSQALALAFPDRIAQQRQPGSHRYLLSNGKGVQLVRSDSLCQHPFLVVLDCDGDPREPYVKLACPIDLAQLRQSLSHQIQSSFRLDWDAEKKQVVAQNLEKLGQLSLSQKPVPKPWPLTIQNQAQEKLLQAITVDQLEPLPWNDASEQLLSRIRWLHQQHPEQWPDASVETLIETAGRWLSPFLNECSSYKDLAGLDLHSALINILPWDQQQQLNAQAPSHWPLATGRSQRIDYSDQGGPLLSAPLQAFYGLNQHPTLPNGVPIRLQLLSPARRPLQITQDLPNFWAGSYVDIAKEMRGRYPKHHWPKQPELAQATEKAKPRGKQGSPPT